MTERICSCFSVHHPCCSSMVYCCSSSSCSSLSFSCCNSWMIECCLSFSFCTVLMRDCQSSSRRRTTTTTCIDKKSINNVRKQNLMECLLQIIMTVLIFLLVCWVELSWIDRKGSLFSNREEIRKVKKKESYTVCKCVWVCVID